MSGEELAFRGFALMCVVYILVIGAVVALYALRDWLRSHPPQRLPEPSVRDWARKCGPMSRDLCKR